MGFMGFYGCIYHFLGLKVVIVRGIVSFSRLVGGLQWVWRCACKHRLFNLLVFFTSFFMCCSCF